MIHLKFRGTGSGDSAQDLFYFLQKRVIEDLQVLKPIPHSNQEDIGITVVIRWLLVPLAILLLWAVGKGVLFLLSRL